MRTIKKQQIKINKELEQIFEEAKNIQPQKKLSAEQMDVYILDRKYFS